MPLYLDTRGETNAAIAICDRCKTKVKIAHLVSDPNSPGLRVCHDTCKDIYDPYRLPARKPENITLRYPRPDEPLEITGDDGEFLMDGEEVMDGEEMMDG